MLSPRRTLINIAPRVYGKDTAGSFTLGAIIVPGNRLRVRGRSPNVLYSTRCERTANSSVHRAARFRDDQIVTCSVAAAAAAQQSIPITTRAVHSVLSLMISLIISPSGSRAAWNPERWNRSMSLRQNKNLQRLKNESKNEQPVHRMSEISKRIDPLQSCLIFGSVWNDGSCPYNKIILVCSMRSPIHRDRWVEGQSDLPKLSTPHARSFFLVS